jgi:hypothetical protein
MINMLHNDATVIIPGPGLEEAEVLTHVAPVFSAPYTYSDMTGSQLRLATASHGYYRELYRGCGTGGPIWRDLVFDVFTPAGTSVVFVVRTASTPEALEEAEWVVVATVPDDESPVSVAEALGESGVAHGSLLELEIRLARADEAADRRATPVVFDASVTTACAPY